MKHFFVSPTLFMVFAILSIALSFACAPQSGPRTFGAVVEPKSQAVTLQGTVSGGGGNGCEGAAFEAYAKKINTLEEYRIYIRPMLRRMTEEGSDPFLTYLLWAAEEKAWYFIPCELAKLSTEQIGIAVDSDQLARHGEHGIYIHSVEEDAKNPRDKRLPPLKTYAQKKSKERAALLVHEMVMGARLLMKKTAKEQCLALAKKDTNLCLDSTVIEAAETKPIDPKEAMVMDAQDHEAIRSMTAYLTEKGADLSAEKVKATRERLGFNFPWSRAASNVDIPEVADAFHRSSLSGDRYAVSKEGLAHFNGEPATCSIAYWADEDYGSVRITFVSKVASSSQPEIEKFKRSQKLQIYSTVCSDISDRIYDPRTRNSSDEKTGCATERHNVSWPDGLNAPIYRSQFSIRGVLVNTVAYDEVKLVIRHDPSYPSGLPGDVKPQASVVRILLTREKSPRVHSIGISPKQLLKRAAKNAESDAVEELLDIAGVSPLECVRQPAR